MKRFLFDLTFLVVGTSIPSTQSPTYLHLKVKIVHHHWHFPNLHPNFWCTFHDRQVTQTQPSDWKRLLQALLIWTIRRAADPHASRYSTEPNFQLLSIQDSTDPMSRYCSLFGARVIPSSFNVIQSSWTYRHFHIYKSQLFTRYPPCCWMHHDLSW